MTEFRGRAETAPTVGVLHRKLRWDPVGARDLTTDGCAVIHPEDVLDHKQNEWAQLWAPPEMEVDGVTRDIQAFGDLCSDIRFRFQGEAPPPLAIPGIRKSLGRMKVNGAMGADMLSAHDLARLPDAALQELCVIFS
eukprot:668607-Pyramimonas_sp.AAC.1